MATMRRIIDLVETGACTTVESFDIHGTCMFEKPSFELLRSSASKMDFKGQVFSSHNDLLVWDTSKLSHHNVAAEMVGLEADDPDAPPGHCFYVTTEGHDTDSEWGNMPFVEGTGFGSTLKMEHEFVGLSWDVECDGGNCPKIYKLDKANTDRCSAFLRQSARLTVNTAGVVR